MVLRVDTFHESFRLSLYASFWILNRTDLQLEFQVKSQRSMFADIHSSPVRLDRQSSKFDRYEGKTDSDQFG